MKLRHLVALGAIGLFAAFGPTERTSPTRWALLVGISDYTNFGDEIGGDLPGAVNDARDWRDVLVGRMGFPEENIRMLLDGEATRDGIREGLTGWLRSNVRAGDRVVFVFAGHGSQMWDTNGDEADGLDETICPVDVTRGSTDADISDDEIEAWLNSIPTDDITVIWDKCHAESSTRAVVPFARPRSLGRDVTQDVPKPTDAAASVSRAAAGESTADGRRKEILELAASASDEVAMDVAWPLEDGSTRSNGAFSTFLIRNLWNAPAGLSYRELFELAKADMKRERLAQTPALSGTLAERPAFLLASEAAYAAAPGTRRGPAAGVPITKVEGSNVELGAGRTAGLTKNSVLGVGGATLRVTGVAGGSSRALRATGPEADLKVGARAHLVAFEVPDVRLKVSVVDLPAALRATLAKDLGTSSVTLVDDARSFAHLTVRPKGSDLVVYGLDGAERHLVGATAIGRLAELLGNEQGAQALAELDNPGRPFVVEFSMTGSKTRFGLGEEVGFRVKSGRDGYLTIVDLGTDGKVRVIYPNEFVRDNRIRAGQEVRFPNEAMSSEGIAFQAEPPVGRGIVRAFVTEKPLVVPFTEGEASQAGVFANALRQAAGASPLPGSALPVAGWAAASVSYQITN